MKGILKRSASEMHDPTSLWRLVMAVSYNKLWKMMVDRNLSKTELTHLAGISTNAMAKLGRNEDVRVRVLEKLCTSLDCKLDDIVEFVPSSDRQQ